MSLVELHDPYFQGYSHAVMAYGVAVAREMNLQEDLIDEITVAALLHDIGKYVMKQQVLLAERQLSSEEMVTIQNHCRMAVKILEGIDFPWRVKDIIYAHHERYDGSGYPEGKRGRGIPLGARIISAVSGYLAMTANRPHRLAMNREDAVVELKNNAGTQFDPEVVEVFLSLLERSPIEKTMGFSRHILLVDEEMDFLSVCTLALAKQGFHPVKARSSLDRT